MANWNMKSEREWELGTGVPLEQIRVALILVLFKVIWAHPVHFSRNGLAADWKSRDSGVLVEHVWDTFDFIVYKTILADSQDDVIILWLENGYR